MGAGGGALASALPRPPNSRVNDPGSPSAGRGAELLIAGLASALPKLANICVNAPGLFSVGPGAELFTGGLASALPKVPNICVNAPGLLSPAGGAAPPNGAPQGEAGGACGKTGSGPARSLARNNSVNPPLPEAGAALGGSAGTGGASGWAAFTGIDGIGIGAVGVCAAFKV